MKSARLAVPVCVAALAAALLVQPLAAAAESTAPSIYGWWSQASVAGPDPTGNADVPPDGMLVQNAASGPLALSALQFSLTPGAAADTLTLDISGQPVITQPPVACPATTAFTAAEGGSWSNAPAYDCSHPASGVVNAASTAIQFPVAALAKAGSLAVVVLAGGPTDRIAFSKPGAGALSETVAAPATPTGDFTPPPPVTVPFPATVPAPSVPAPAVAPPAPASPGVAALPPPARSPAAVATATAGSGPSPPAGGGPVAGLTVGLLVLAILYWTDGFGALRLRTSLASRRLTRRSG